MRATGPCWYAKWYRATKPVIRALGRAWVVVDHESEWKPRRGRPSDDALTESQAGQRMLEVIREHNEQQTRLERAVEARRRDGVTFRELAAEYLLWLEDVKDAKPSTLSGHRYLLAEPGAGHRRGNGRADGFIMAALGDQPASRISTRDIENVLRRVAAPRKARGRRSRHEADDHDARRPTHGQPASAADARDLHLRDPAEHVWAADQPREVCQPSS